MARRVEQSTGSQNRRQVIDHENTREDSHREEKRLIPVWGTNGMFWK